MTQQTNIFKDVKFGDRFVTTDARILIYHCPTVKNNEPVIVHQLIEEFNSDIIICDENGKCINMPDYRTDIDTDTVHSHYNQYDVVEKYTETIDEKELDELAENIIIGEHRYLYPAKELKNLKMRKYHFKQGYKYGYRKAKEN